MRTLKTDQCLAQDILALINIEPIFGIASKATGSIPLRKRKDGYSSLVRTIVGQQVSVASANAIYLRLEEAGFDNLENIKSASDEMLLSCGLSRQKTTYLKALAHADIDFQTLSQKDDKVVFEELTAVKGIGPWSAEIYLMFALGRADVLSSGDLALQEGAKILFDLQERPTAKELAIMAENWSPYRNAAAQLLWAYYHVKKQKDGIGL